MQRKGVSEIWGTVQAWEGLPYGKHTNGRNSLWPKWRGDQEDSSEGLTWSRPAGGMIMWSGGQLQRGWLRANQLGKWSHDQEDSCRGTDLEQISNPRPNHFSRVSSPNSSWVCQKHGRNPRSSWGPFDSETPMMRTRVHLTDIFWKIIICFIIFR